MFQDIWIILMGAFNFSVEHSTDFINIFMKPLAHAIVALNMLNSYPDRFRDDIEPQRPE